MKSVKTLFLPGTGKPVALERNYLDVSDAQLTLDDGV